MTEATITATPLSEHVLQIAIPTPTLPPADSTNTYIVHQGSEALWVDLGTEDTGWMDQALRIVREHGWSVTGIVATHFHRDHTRGIPYLHQQTQAPVYIHPLDADGAAHEMAQSAFPAPTLEDVPARFQLQDVTVSVHHAPGHTQGHIHLTIEPDGVILVGDHLAGDGSVWIGAPDGDMTAYYQALDHVRISGCHIAGPGHGVALQDASAAAIQLKQRRHGREQQIRELTQHDALTAREIVQAIYGDDIPDTTRFAALRTVQAHLKHLIHLVQIEPLPQGADVLNETTRFRAVATPLPVDLPTESV